MVTATTRSQEEKLVREKLPRVSIFTGRNAAREYFAAALFGCLFGLSAPGHDSWYLAWCALVPLFHLIYSASTKWQASLRATIFGFAYNFVYLHWLYSIHASENCPVHLRILLVFCVCLHQSLLFGAFAGIARTRVFAALPILLPLLWVLVFNKLGNSQVFFGVPWSMIEYSQYQNSTVLSLCPLIGGIGIGALLVQSNLSLFLLSGGTKYFSRMPTVVTLVFSLVTLAAASTAVFTASLEKTKKENAPITIEPHANLTLLQGNISFKRHKASVPELVDRYMQLSASAPASAALPSLCLWPEWSIPLHFRSRAMGASSMAGLAAVNKQDWIVGALDSDRLGRSFNAVYAFSAQGKMLDSVYRKRMLVLFGEYMPWVLSAPRGDTYATGTSAVVLPLSKVSVGPLICLEVLSPEYASETTRLGAQVLVDASNTTWFDTSLVGRQMLAFSVFRAAECGRYLAFCTTTGPSCVVDRSGRIITCTESNKVAAPTTQVTLYDDLTPFVRWFR